MGTREFGRIASRSAPATEVRSVDPVVPWVGIEAGDGASSTRASGFFVRGGGAHVLTAAHALQRSDGSLLPEVRVGLIDETGARVAVDAWAWSAPEGAYAPDVGMVRLRLRRLRVLAPPELRPVPDRVLPAQLIGFRGAELEERDLLVAPLPPLLEYLEGFGSPEMSGGAIVSSADRRHAFGIHTGRAWSSGQFMAVGTVPSGTVLRACRDGIEEALHATSRLA